MALRSRWSFFLPPRQGYRTGTDENSAKNCLEEFQKRLNYFIKMTEKNKQFGFGGIEKYY